MRGDKEPLSALLSEPVCSWSPLGSLGVWMVGFLPTWLPTPPGQADTTKVLGLVVGETLAAASERVLPALTHLRASFQALRLLRCPAWKSAVPLLDPEIWVQMNVRQEGSWWPQPG